MTFLLTNKTIFPHPELSTDTGVIALGGDLNRQRLLLAYQYGIFPWNHPEDPLMWWYPVKRFVLFPDKIYVSKSLRRVCKKESYNVTFDRSFSEVISLCKKTHDNNHGNTWITNELMDTFIDLHNYGCAHSVEIWNKNELIGGLYGIGLGKVFFGESMFSKKSNASKLALLALARRLEKENYHFIDCQIESKHLSFMGAEFMERSKFRNILKENIFNTTILGSWGKYCNAKSINQLV